MQLDANTMLCAISEDHTDKALRAMLAAGMFVTGTLCLKKIYSYAVAEWLLRQKVAGQLMGCAVDPSLRHEYDTPMFLCLQANNTCSQHESSTQPIRVLRYLSTWYSAQKNLAERNGQISNLTLRRPTFVVVCILKQINNISKYSKVYM